MGRKRIFDDHVLTAQERQDRFQHYSIDNELDEALSNVDWNRRREAETDIVKWVKTYCVGLLLEDAPSVHGEEVLRKMMDAMKSHNNFQILLSRGSGKSVFELSATLMSMCTGQQKYIVIVSNNSRAANQLIKDIWRIIIEPDTTLAKDYPEVFLPYQLAKGSYRRKQLYNGHSTEISKNAGEIVFPTLRHKDGSMFITSGITMTSRGVQSGMRGLRKGIQRPTCVLLDDLQDFETASNPEQVKKLYDIIRKDIIPLAGKQRLSIIMTATPITSEDLVQKIKEDTSWKTTTFPAIISYPNDFKKDDSLWKKYFQMFDRENVEDKKHEGSLQFYKEHQSEMDEGSEVFNPKRFSLEDGHITALQKLLEIRHSIGNNAFMSEYQMKPVKTSTMIDITPNIVASRIGTHQILEVPDNVVYVSCGLDINSSYGLTYSIVGFTRDMTAYVLYKDIFKCQIDGKLTDSAYYNKLFEVLVSCTKHIKQLGIRIDGVAIDCSGKQWNAVCDFSKNSMQLVGLPCCGFSGRASHLFNPLIRSRLRNAVGRTVLCGNADERVKSGAGQKYVFFDADLMKEQVQKAFLNTTGNIGSCSLYQTEDKDEHTEFALQICNEKLLWIHHKQTGQYIYSWKSAEPHDYLDTMSMAYACAVNAGLGMVTNEFKIEKRVLRPMKRRIRIV